MCSADGVAIECRNGIPTNVLDCRRGDRPCIARGAFAACGERLSKGDPGAPPAGGDSPPRPCADGSPEAVAPGCSTDGAKIELCMDGERVSFHCAPFGMRCRFEGAWPHCAPPTDLCREGEVRWEGTNAVRCFRGHEIRTDCAAADMGCSLGGDWTRVGDCEAPVPSHGRECVEEEPPRCEGNRARYCFSGEVRRIECASVGMSECTDEGGVVRCVEGRDR
jgi:hypothetical protein